MPTTYGSNNREEEAAFVRRIAAPPRRKDSAQKKQKTKFLLGASALLLGAGAAVGGLVALQSDGARATVAAVGETQNELLRAELLAQASVATEISTSSFEGMDINSDGLVTKDEFLARVHDRLAQVLARINASNLDDGLKVSLSRTIEANLKREMQCVSSIFDKSGAPSVNKEGFEFVRPLIQSLCDATSDSFTLDGGQADIQPPLPSATTVTIDGVIVPATGAPSDENNDNGEPSTDDAETSEPSTTAPSDENNDNGEPSTDDAETSEPSTTAPSDENNDNGEPSTDDAETSEPSTTAPSDENNDNGEPSTDDAETSEPSTTAPSDENNDNGEPSTDDAETSEPSTTAPSDENNDNGEPSTDDAETSEPSTTAPSDENNDNGEPSTDDAETSEPSTTAPSDENNDNGEPSTDDAETSEPSTTAPSDENNDNGEPSTDDAETSEPSTTAPSDENNDNGEPSTDDAETSEPSTTAPSDENNDNGEPSTDDAETSEPSTTAPSDENNDNGEPSSEVKVDSGSSGALSDALKDVYNAMLANGPAGGSEDVDISDYWNRLSPGGSGSGHFSEPTKSAERVAFENGLHDHFASEIQERKQNMRYMAFQAKKQAIFAELMETCIAQAGERFEVDRSFFPGRRRHVD
ncbi:hypothetical protein PINS_up012917 [Pythium insidiosum]|nr:hypothetical protein PINS_up012917 [Pythium insidiosum]